MSARKLSKPSTAAGGAAASGDDLTFEDSLAQLEQIVRQLEDGQLGLGDSLQKYEEGVARLRHCQQALADAEARIEILFRIDEEGRAEVRPFDEREMTLEEKQTARSRRRSSTEEERGLF